MTSILITGGAGSFGRAFVKEALGLSSMGRVCIFSRGEHTQYAMAQELAEHASRLRFFVGDVRDRDRLRRAFEGVDIVIHAAALKRIEVGAYNPIEMVKTNVLGAMNVIEAAQDAGVSKVVALSTDKAYQPISPYGQSKALAESLFLNANTSSRETRFAVTRYGNVAGSAGSVIPKWKELIASGADYVPITDPDCTRFFMTMDDAVTLVLNTIAVMPSEIVIPNLPAFRLGDLAMAMGMGARVNITGLPPWEKMHESMSETQCSLDARRMSVEELRGEILKL